MKDFRGGDNRLLSSLPAGELSLLEASLEQVYCGVGDVLTESGRTTRHVYFPITCTAALIYTTADGATSGMAVIGDDALVGVSVILGGGALPGRAEVLIGGNALKMGADGARDHFRRGGPFQRVLLRYTQALLAHISQTGVCQGLHSVERRLARCLLLTLDRSQRSADLPLTQDTLAVLLGVRRESVSHAAAALQGAGCIRYVRGHVRVIDRRGLEQASCECYRVIRNEVSPAPEILPPPPRTQPIPRASSG